MSLMLPDGVVAILKSHEKALPDYEHVKFIIDNEKVEVKIYPSIFHFVVLDH